MPPQEKLLGGQTRFSKISLYLVLKGRKNFRGAFGAAKTLQLFINYPLYTFLNDIMFIKTGILAKLLNTESFLQKIHHSEADLLLLHLILRKLLLK